MDLDSNLGSTNGLWTPNTALGVAQALLKGINTECVTQSNTLPFFVVNLHPSFKNILKSLSEKYNEVKSETQL